MNSVLEFQVYWRIRAALFLQTSAIFEPIPSPGIWAKTGRRLKKNTTLTNRMIRTFIPLLQFQANVRR
jgi:hypothetical protein